MNRASKNFLEQIHLLPQKMRDQLERYLRLHPEHVRLLVANLQVKRRHLNNPVAWKGIIEEELSQLLPQDFSMR